MPGTAARLRQQFMGRDFHFMRIWTFNFGHCNITTHITTELFRVFYLDPPGLEIQQQICTKNKQKDRGIFCTEMNQN
jgi:hypothetical protein